MQVENSPKKESPRDDRPFVRTSVCDDRPARKLSDDALGFAVYVEALAAFLINRKTNTPLTVSVEGEWGSGKTSFLRQLMSVISAARRPTVFFNAWRHDRDESLWAAFALACIKSLRKGKKPHIRAWDDLALRMSRFDFDEAAPALGKIAIRLILLVAIIVLFVKQGWLGHLQELSDVAKASEAAGLRDLLVGGAGLISTGWIVISLFNKARELVGDPFEVELEKYVQDPKYKARISFVETFHEDFARVLKHYVHPDKLFIFIDDLDRCDVSRSSELMQAINMLTSADEPGPVFIIGMDRKIVAAALTARYESLIPFLFPARPQANGNATQSEEALDFGYAFMDKFIQLPFKVPRARAEYLPWLLEPSRIKQPEKNRLADSVSDSTRAECMIEAAASVLNYNPRRIKQFVNVFRLTVHIYVVTNVLSNTYITPGQMPGMRELTIEKLARFLAIILRWPRFVDLLEEDPQVLGELQKIALSPAYQSPRPVPDVSRFRGLMAFLAAISNNEFRVVDWTELERRKIFSLEALDIRDLLQIIPIPRAAMTDQLIFEEDIAPVTLDEIHAAGIPSLVANESGHGRNRLELVVPLASGRLGHFSYHLNGESGAWRGEPIRYSAEGGFEAAAMIQSRYDKGNLELVARSKDTLMFMFRTNEDDTRWQKTENFRVKVTASAALIQSKVVDDGNFELVVARKQGGLQHLWRDNAQNGRPWQPEEPFALAMGQIAPVALFEEFDGGTSNLRLFALVGTDLFCVLRQNYQWGAPRKVTSAPAFYGHPGIVRKPGFQDVFVCFVPAATSGFGHWEYDAAKKTWTRIADEPSSSQIDAIAAVVDAAGYELVMRSQLELHHQSYRFDDATWKKPQRMAIQNREYVGLADMAGRTTASGARV